MALEATQSNPIRINSAATTNATLIQAGKSILSSLLISNIGAAAAFVKLYDKATAPIPGTDVPILTIPVPAGGIVALAVGDIGPPLELGLAFTITNLAADLDTTAVVAGQVKVIGNYFQQ